MRLLEISNFLCRSLKSVVSQTLIKLMEQRQKRIDKDNGYEGVD